MMIPLLLQPQWLAMCNSLRLASRSPRAVVRASVLSLFSIGIVFAIYFGTKRMLFALQEHADVAWLPPSIPLGLFFLFIGSMVFLSAAVSAIGALFHARDLDLILASPIHPGRFFIHTLIEVLIASSWLVFLFAFPVLAGFAKILGADYTFYLLGIAVLVPLLVIPSSLGMIAATAISALVPVTRTKELAGILVVLTFGGLVVMFQLLVPENSSAPDITSVLKMINLMLIPHGLWSPSYWASSVMSSALGEGGSSSVALYLGLLYSAAGVSFSLAYLTVGILHRGTYSRSKANRLGGRATGAGFPQLISWLPLSPSTRAMVIKEYCSFMRDMTQAAQLIVLLGICVLYLYNLQTLRTVGGLPETVRGWWNGFLAVSNLCLGAFVMSALCTRFVFPSLSLEGQSFWILQTSPLSTAEILRKKFQTWLLPCMLISSVIFTAGAFAIDANPGVIALHLIASVLLSVGITGLAVGTGAYFANFDWEHQSQLAASFGALVFMLLSIMLIMLNMTVPLFLIFLNATRDAGEGALSDTSWYTVVTLCMVLMGHVNWGAARWGLALGTRELERRRGNG